MATTQAKTSIRPASLSPEAQSALESLKQLLQRVHHLVSASSLLGWDMETTMPANGAGFRSAQLATLSTLAHEITCSSEMSGCIGLLRQPELLAKLDQTHRAMVREAAREYDQATKLPARLVQALAETSANAHHIWVEARKHNDFKAFEPALKQLLALNREKADALGYEGSAYNALLDLYEPGLKVEALDPLFSNLKQHTVALVQAIANSNRTPSTHFLHKTSSLTEQEQFSRLIIEDMGFDLMAGRLDTAPHPFCSGSHPSDIRLTTRYNRNDLLSSLFSCMHEAGHGLYEQGSDPALADLRLGGGASLGIHESQSRLWENMVGRSKLFWKHYLPKLRARFPKHLNGIDLNTFYRAINRVQPSLIRVEADEVTYNLHILLRFELERDLVEGKLAVHDLPEAWRHGMQKNLGVCPTNDANGCLQDIHWSMGAFGYFPTYTLGNLYAAQFYRKACQQLSTLEKSLNKAAFRQLRQWLKDEIHWLGQIEPPGDIVQRVTGEPLNAQYFVNYVWQKYGDLYALPEALIKQHVKPTAMG
ncbi:MAG: carboxypeptidase M32 [Candidatus Melainabacteria bacterium]|nr:carboxypeptidase M32 [Candidatus Melainabacteria bacterium]